MSEVGSKVSAFSLGQSWQGMFVMMSFQTNNFEASSGMKEI